jgi:hypothetical protein
MSLTVGEMIRRDEERRKLMARVQVDECLSCRRLMGEKHVATVPRPTMSELEDIMMDTINCYATDGCDVEQDGMCEHGHQSWMLKMALI